MTMLKLFYAPGSASLAVHWLLLEARIAHSLHKVDLKAKEHKTAEYLRMNPVGVVPTLMINDRPMGESAAIVVWLADEYAANKLAPSIGHINRSAYLRWMFFCANTLQPAFRHWFYPNEAAGETCAVAAKQVAQNKVEAGWELVSEHFADGRAYLLGEHLSAADLMLAMLMRWSRNFPRPATAFPHLMAFADRMRSLESFKRLCEIEELTEWCDLGS